MRNAPLQKTDLKEGGEMDLYGELIAFSALAPDEQATDASERAKAVAAAANHSEEDRSESAHIPPAVEEHTTALSESSDAARKTVVKVYEGLPSGPLTEPDSARGFVVLDADEILAEDQPKDFSKPVNDARNARGVSGQYASGEGETHTSTPAQDERTEALLPQARSQAEMEITGPLRGIKQSFEVRELFQSVTACPACGSESDGRDLFCVECGSLLDETEEDEAASATVEPYCADCGTITAPDEMFCPGCGAFSSLA
jgi:double zinc ribbon protein